MANDGIDKALSGAKAALAKANKDFPSPKKAPVVTAKPAPVADAAAKGAAPNLGSELRAKQDNVDQYTNAPKMHEGGIVPGKKGEEVPIIAKAGETVVPPVEQKGRASEYRNVFLARRQSRQGGGHTPAKGEQHDAAKG